MKKEKIKNQIFKNIGYPVSLEEHKLRESVKIIIETEKNQHLTEKEFEICLFEKFLDIYKK
jgi:hypothetical protein